MFKSILGSFEDAPVEQYVVKSVIGKTVEEARELEGIKDVFEIKEAGSEFNDEYEAGKIIRQDPEEGEYRKGENAVINVWVSLGEDTGVMIDVTEERTVAQAKTDLKSLINKYNLTIEALEEDKEFSDEVTEGFIIRTDPAAGEVLKKGDTIRLIVSKGPELKEFAMPDFVGKNIEVVQEQLKNTWHLTCNPATDIVMVYSSRPGGEIVKQSIPETTMVKEWDTVVFEVSSGIGEAFKAVGLICRRMDGSRYG